MAITIKIKAKCKTELGMQRMLELIGRQVTRGFKKCSDEDGDGGYKFEVTGEEESK